MNLSEHVTLYIQRNTKKGESLADFLLDTMHGRTPYAKFSHQFKAVELLTLYGGFIPDHIPTLDNLPARNDASGKPAKKTKKHKVTEKELLNYDIIRMIKQDTRNGELLVDLLIHVAIEGKMSNSRRFISPSTRMRAAQELLTRGFGAVSPRRIPSGKNEGLGATISKRIRKDTDNGREAAAYLMDIVIGNPPASKPSKRKRFTPHRRVLAACELLRRLCDIRTDHITPEHIQAYWTSQTPIDARARETHANSRPDINRTGIDKATALAAMATKPAEAAASDEPNNAAPVSKPSNTANTAETTAVNNAAESSKDPFTPRGNASTGASPTTDAAETQTAAASDDPNNAAPVSKPSNTANTAETTAVNNAAESSKDPFTPRGNASTGASPTTDAAETQTAAASDEPNNTAPVSKPSNTAAKPTAAAERDNAAPGEPSVNNTAVDTQTHTANATKPSSTAAAKPATQDPFPPREKAKREAPPAAVSAETQAAAAIDENDDAISNPPNDNTPAASEPSNTAKTAVSHERDTTPSHPTAPASNPSRKPTRRQRRKANKRKQRRAQRKARSP